MTTGWLGLRKVALHLDCSISTVRRMVRDGDLEAGKVRGCLKVSRESLTEHEKRMRREGQDKNEQNILE